MSPLLGTGLLVALASMVGTLIALGIIAGCIAALHRLFPPAEAAEGPKA